MHAYRGRSHEHAFSTPLKTKPNLPVTLQVRQHTGHKRTFFYLEQLILKFNADAQCINIKEMHEVSLLGLVQCR